MGDQRGSVVMAAGKSFELEVGIEKLNCGVTVVLPAGFDVRCEKSMDELGIQVAPLMREHNLVHVRQAAAAAAAAAEEAEQEDESPPPPSAIRAFYRAVHAERFNGVDFAPPARPARSSNAHKPTDDGNIRGASFPGFNETHALGRSAVVEDWHGLTGSLKPRSWWEDASGQWHSDGGFSKYNPVIPLLVMMSCECAPDAGGETCFYTTHAALTENSEDVVERARRMRCVYHQGFGRVEPGVYPIMSKSWLVPTSQSPKANCLNEDITRFHRSVTEMSDDDANDGKAAADLQPFMHNLVQSDDAGRDFITVHAVCLDHLEEQQEDGEWKPLEWKEGQNFIEQLLLPAAHPSRVLKLKWRRGDWAIWDNIRTQHSVTPQDVHIGMRRMMTRTAMQPKQRILV